jgi:peptide/nickel transport system ATP-binding protein
VAAWLPLPRPLPERVAGLRRDDAGPDPALRDPQRALPRGGGRGLGVTPTSPAPILRVEGLRTWFSIRKGLFQRSAGWVRAVDGVDLEIPAGRTLALVGESGCGKSTVGRSLLRLVEPQAGRVWLDGVDLLALGSEELRPHRRAIQIVFQDPMSSLDPRMRVRDAVAEGMVAFGIGADEEERSVRALFERVRLDPDQIWRYPHEFSGGQRQRICIARALAVGPRVLVCDEATSALDVSIQAQILNLLRDLQEDLGLTYLFITHDLGVVRYLADRVAVMYVGEIVEQGPTEQIFERPAHPYTQGLLAAIPSTDPERRGLQARVIGDVPSPANPPEGCRFHPRCPQAFERCRRESPPVVRVGVSESRCFLQDPEAR